MPHSRQHHRLPLARAVVTMPAGGSASFVASGLPAGCSDELRLSTVGGVEAHLEADGSAGADPGDVGAAEGRTSAGGGAEAPAEEMVCCVGGDNRGAVGAGHGTSAPNGCAG